MDGLKVGRIVHYVAYGTPGGEFPKVCRAAVVTEVETRKTAEQLLSLCVLNPSGLFFNQHLPEKEVTPETTAAMLHGGTWHDPRTCSR